MTAARTVKVLVSRSCRICDGALSLASEVRALRPDLDVRVEYVDEPGWTAPVGFIGTPAFYVGDLPVSWGNPTREWLLARLPEPGGDRDRD